MTRRSSQVCTCGHVRGGHFYGRRTRIWLGCKRCPYGACTRFTVNEEPG